MPSRIKNIVFQESSMHRERGILISIYGEIVDADQANAQGNTKPGSVWR